MQGWEGPTDWHCDTSMFRKSEPQSVTLMSTFLGNGLIETKNKFIYIFPRAFMYNHIYPLNKTFIQLFSDLKLVSKKEFPKACWIA